MARRDGVESKYHLTTGSKHNLSAMESKTTQLLYETFVNFRGLVCGTNVKYRSLGGTRVKFRFLAYLVNSGRPAWSMVQIREKLPMATAQATCGSAGE